MVDRGPYKGQTQRNIYGFPKRETFYRNHSLIVIARNYGIKFTP